MIEFFGKDLPLTLKIARMIQFPSSSQEKLVYHFTKRSGKNYASCQAPLLDSWLARGAAKRI
jgi:hypothetical protein